MEFLLRFNKSVLFSTLAILFSLNTEAQQLRGICPKLEGSKFINCLTTPPICNGTCGNYSSQFLVCQGFSVCGTSCTGTAPDTQCPDPSTYSKCDPRPSTACGVQCAEGTKPETNLCTGVCYTTLFDSYSYKVPTGGGCTSTCTGYSDVTTCTTTEAGQVCESHSVCNGYEQHCEPATCSSQTMSCVKGSTSTPNVAVGCGCTCGQNGESPPTPTCGSPPPDQCQ